MKVICDEIFGRDNFIASIIWEKRTSRENRRVFSFNHDYILLYAKSKLDFEKTRNPLDLTQEVLARYKNPDNDKRGPWQSVSANAQAGHATPNQFYTLTLPSGRKIDPPKGRCWLYTTEKMEKEIAANNIWFGSDGDKAPRVKKFLKDNEQKGLTPETIWPASDVGTNDDAKKGLLQLLESAAVFDNPKPERLVERIIHIATNPGDLVLDSFLGSGTTAAVAHKMGRRWIGVELGEHAITHCVPRLQKVIDGEDSGGITKAVDWKGGGGFTFYRLAPSLLNLDSYGNFIISKDYNPDMLAAAMAKHEGFRYNPHELVYWKQGTTTGADFIFTTTQLVTLQMIEKIQEEMKPGESLLICCKSFQKECRGKFSNITIKKIPQVLIGKCEFGKEDYSLNIVDTPKLPDDTDMEEDITMLSAQEISKKTKKKVEQGSLFDL